MSERLIKLVTDFTSAPGARFRKQSKYSGEEFREDFIKPAIQRGTVLVDLNGALGLPPSFLDEAFGVLLQEDRSAASKIKLLLTDNDNARAVLKDCIARRIDAKTSDAVFVLPKASPN